LGEEITLIDAPPEPFPLQPRDILLFASDGLQMLDEKAIAAFLSRDEATTAPQLIRGLFDAVEELDHPKQDNVTLAAVLLP